MRDIIRDRWLGFSEPLEGGCAVPYADIRGKVTIAYGNLCDSPGEMAALPLFRPDGTEATVDEKIEVWRIIHNDPNAAAGGWRYAAKLTKLRLTRDGMAGLALHRLELNDRILAGRLAPDWESYGACVQMALHSVAWAAGAMAHFPRLYQAVRDKVFAKYESKMVNGELTSVLVGGAALEIKMNEWTPEGKLNSGLVPRNAANRILMCNAQRVLDYGLDPDTVEWKSLIDIGDLKTPGAMTVAELSNTATYPTLTPEPILHIDPHRYFGDDPDPEDAA